MMPDQINEPKKSNTLLISIIIIIVLVIATYIVFHYIKKTDTITITEIPQAVDTETPTPTTPSSIYRDGVYTAIGLYNSPGGAEQITISLTLKNDVVVDTTAQINATRPESVKYQTMFVDNYKTSIVGKNIADLSLSKVSGSSLTPKGFNDALAKIKVQAKA